MRLFAWPYWLCIAIIFYRISLSQQVAGISPGLRKSIIKPVDQPVRVRLVGAREVVKPKLLMIWQKPAWPSSMLEAFMAAVREGVGDQK